MILSAIFHFLKMVLGCVIKVIAWLLVSLSLWVPLLYTLVFLIVCGLTGESLTALKSWYFAGLALSFIGSFAISSYFYERRLKNKKREKKAKSNIEKVKAMEETPEIVRADEQPAPPPELSPLNDAGADSELDSGRSGLDSGNSIVKQAMAESQADSAGKRGRVEMRSKGETAVKHGFFSYDSSQSSGQEDSRGYAQGSPAFESYNSNTQGGTSQYSKQSSQDFVGNHGFAGNYDKIGADGYAEPPVSGGYRYAAEESYGAGNNRPQSNAADLSQNSGRSNYSSGSYNANYSQGGASGGFKQGERSDYTAPQASDSAGFSQGPYNAGYQGGGYPQDGGYPQGAGYQGTNYPQGGAGYSEPRDGFQKSFATESNFSAQSSFDGYESFNVFDAPISGGRETRLGGFEPDSQRPSRGFDSSRQEFSAESFDTPVSAGGFDEQPRIFATRNDPTVFIYEYSDRLDYYKHTRSGMIFMRSIPKTRG